MRTLVFTVFDSAAKRYLEPFFAPTVEVALRMFRTIVNTPEHQFSKYPEDYTLFVIGEFDQETAELVKYQEVRSLGVALTYVDASRAPELSGPPLEAVSAS